MWRESHYLNNYNIKFQDFLELLDFQGGLCPICKEDLIEGSKGSEKPCLDHNHKTGEVRGIIHSRCNIALGYFRDNIEALEGAVKYLKNPPARIFFSRDLIDT